MAKRGSRRPERASTKPPAEPKSSFPRRDSRPPKGDAKAPVPLPKSLDAPLRQRMTDETWMRKAKTYVAQMGEVQALRDSKARENKRRQEEIDELLSQTEKLRLDLVQGEEDLRQGDLFATGTPTPAETDQALAQAAEHLGGGGNGKSSSGSEADDLDDLQRAIAAEQEEPPAPISSDPADVAAVRGTVHP